MSILQIFEPGSSALQNGLVTLSKYNWELANIKTYQKSVLTPISRWCNPSRDKSNCITHTQKLKIIQAGQRQE